MKRSRKRLNMTCLCGKLCWFERNRMGYKTEYLFSPMEKRLKRFMRFQKRNNVPMPWDEVWARFKGWAQ